MVVYIDTYIHMIWILVESWHFGNHCMHHISFIELIFVAIGQENVNFLQYVTTLINIFEYNVMLTIQKGKKRECRRIKGNIKRLSTMDYISFRYSAKCRSYRVWILNKIWLHTILFIKIISESFILWSINVSYFCFTSLLIHVIAGTYSEQTFFSANIVKWRLHHNFFFDRNTK